MKKTISAAATDSPSQGFLQVHVVNIENNFPIRNATISISYKGEPDSTLEETTTNSSGQTDQITLLLCWNTAYSPASSSHTQNTT